MGDLLDLQAYICRWVRYVGGEDRVRTIWESIRLAKHVAKQGLKVALQEKEKMDKVKSRSLT